MLILRAVSGASRREAVRASGTTEVASEEAVTVAVKAREDSWEARAVGAGKWF
jgi:hypothetical protein